ncbi:MAG: hypothetical protein MJZ20_04290 [Bacteroidaceae bacterium]|nr:hypothetical protein [Bacteroidaceae bacterium]
MNYFRILIFYIILSTTSIVFGQEPVTIDDAMSMLKTAISKYKLNNGIVLDMSIKVSVLPEFEMRLKYRNKKTMIQVDDEIMYEYNHIKWVYDKQNNKITIGTTETDEMQEIIDFALVPIHLQNDIRKENNRSFMVGNYLVTFNQSKHKWGYTTRIGKATILLLLDPNTQTINQLKVKKGIISITIKYNNALFSCPEESVTFSLKDYPGITVIDKRNIRK